MIFVLGILGLLVCTILGLIAWVQGNDYMRRCRALRVRPDGLAIAGRILGIISTLLLALQVGVVGFLFLLALLANAA